MATFYARVMAALAALGLNIRIHTSERGRRSHSLRAGRNALFITSNAPLFLADSGPGRPGPERNLSRALQRGNAARCMCSGAGSTWRSPAFPAGPRPSIQAAFRIWRTGSRAKRIFTRGQQLWILGRRRPDRLSGVLFMPTRNQRASRTRVWGRTVRSTAATLASSSCPTIASGSPILLTTCCWNFCRRRMRRRDAGELGSPGAGAAGPLAAGTWMQSQ